MKTNPLDLLVPTEAEPILQGKIHTQRGNDDYMTTPHYIKLVRAVLGGTIGCDPATTDIINEYIKADIWFTPERSGLSETPWADGVYLNPPSVNREEFLKRAGRELAYGTVTEMIVCLNTKHLCAGYTHDTILHQVTAVHIPRGRPAFFHPVLKTRTESPTDGRAFLYIGTAERSFLKVFGNDAGWTFACRQYAPPSSPKIQAIIR